MARPPSGAPHDEANHDEQFTEFVQASWTGLYRTAFLLVSDRGLAEDLAQTALAKTYAAWSRIDDGGCSTTPLDLELPDGDVGTVRLGGMVNES